MKKHCLAALICALTLPSFGAFAQDPPAASPSPGEIVAQAPASEWVAIAPEDLLVMELSPDRDGKPRRVIIQLMPPPFSQGWIDNIRKLAAAHWWDVTSVNRVQDNYVVQWGDASEEKPLPDGLVTVPESEYVVGRETALANESDKKYAAFKSDWWHWHTPNPTKDAYSGDQGFFDGFPLANDAYNVWPVHCYGMVGVGRNLSPDTGTGAELYTVIGQAPRHLDRNIALVGRVIEGMEHLSSLPRGTGDLGFYEDPAQRVSIDSLRLASEFATADQPAFEYLYTEGESFSRYAEARANRRDPFFNVPAGGADICNIPVPVRKVTEN